MIDSINEAIEELKRADHLIYVSLKYTRTVDVLLNIISRMIEGYDHIMNAMLKYAVSKNTIKHLPSSPIEKGELVKQLFPEDNVQKNMGLYFLLRKLVKSNPKREHEFRKHLTMRSIIDGREEIVTTDIIMSYYHFQKEFLEYAKDMITKAAEAEKKRL